MASYTAGFRYLFGMHMGVCRGPIDELVEVRVGDRTAWVGSVTSNQVVPIDAYNLFGGEDGEGGVQGNMHVLFGESNQLAPDELAGLSVDAAQGKPLGNIVLPTTSWFEHPGSGDPDDLPLTFQVRLNTDGTMSLLKNGVVSSTDPWFKNAPVLPAATEDYEVKFDATGTFGPTMSLMGTYGAWLPLNVAQAVGLSNSTLPGGQGPYVKMNVTVRRGTEQNTPVEMWLTINEFYVHPGGA
jgi:hypothetical protein